MDANILKYSQHNISGLRNAYLWKELGGCSKKEGFNTIMYNYTLTYSMMLVHMQFFPNFNVLDKVYHNSCSINI